MEAFMRILVSVMALAIALAWAGASEAQGNAQGKKSGVRGSATAQQTMQRPVKKVATRSTGQQRCAGYAWWGCTGWDPDANVRAMLARDVGGDD
jgi:hypothetical protein